MNDKHDAFELGYEKFIDFAGVHRLFPDDRSKIVVAYSGGKDASLLCDFLSEYKNRSRPDISIEIVTINFPRFIYDSSSPERREAVFAAIEYWKNRGFQHTSVDAGPEFPDSILDGDNPCQQCALVIKPTLLGRQISKRQYEGAVYCVGLTLDDSIGWFLELLLVAAGRGDWRDIKHDNPDLFSTIMLLSTRVSCRFEVERNDLLYSRPMMCFSDGEIRTIVTVRELPLIPEDCAEVKKRAAFIDSPRRDLAIALAAVRDKYPADSAAGMGAIYSDYRRSNSYYETTRLLPSLEEREQYISEYLRACNNKGEL